LAASDVVTRENDDPRVAGAAAVVNRDYRDSR
jgi:hypothetical protein